mgnify:CR=1 FL=1
MTDTTVADCIAGEEERQRDGLELIPRTMEIGRASCRERV